MTVIGGGYIAAELTYFYGALGTKINIIQRNKYLVPNEDEEISKRFTEIFSKRYNVLTGYNAVKVSKKVDGFIVRVEQIDKKSKNKIKDLISDCLLIAAGVTPNSDILDVKKTNVEINENGFIKTNVYLETTAKNIWALGDIVGKYFFKHSANLEANYVYNNTILNRRLKVNYTAMPHAIFTSPQIAGVGLTEQKLKEKKIDYAVGKYQYIKTGMGIAIQDNEGFVKLYADRKTKRILGCHILGSEASTLIHEVIVAMKSGLTVDDIMKTVHIHPALSEVVQRAMNNIE